jgi:hypothetical protein
VNWHNDIAESFPERRDDEPESLRDDIAAELADHLVCAVNRELHFTQDEKTAIQRVLARFGDPRQIARKLWFDSMKDKLMAQRLSLMTSMAAVAASIFACVMVYFVTQRSDVTIQAIVSQGKASDDAILQKLETLASRPVSVEFSPVKIRLVVGDANGSPASGYGVLLSRGIPGGPESVQVDKKSDVDGTVDFGLQRYGSYSLSLSTPDGQRASRSLNVSLGEPVSELIVCPAPLTKPDKTEIAIRLEGMDGLLDSDAQLNCRFVKRYVSVGGLHWRDAESDRSVSLLNDGRLIDRGLISFGFSTTAEKHEPTPASTIRWPAATYHLISISLVRMDAVPKSQDPKQVPWVHTNLPFHSFEIVNVHQAGPAFEAKSNQANTWTIPVPEKTRAAIREQMEKAKNERAAIRESP